MERPHVLTAPGKIHEPCRPSGSAITGLLLISFAFGDVEDIRTQILVDQIPIGS